MKVITRTLTAQTLVATGFVLFALVSLIAFFDLVGQAHRIGTQYSIGVALQVMVLNMPMRAYQVTPVAALLGSVYVLSRWAASSEFTILRVSGVSAWRLSKMMLFPALVMIVLTYAVGEWVAPRTDQMVRDLKSVTRGNATLSAEGYSSGVWIKDVVKNAQGDTVQSRYLNVRSIVAGDRSRTGAWRVFEFDGDEQNLERVVSAPVARYIPREGWHLKNARVESLPKITRDTQPMIERAQVRTNADLLLPSEVRPDIIGVMTVRPEYMGIRDLYNYYAHLKVNRQNVDRYEIALWNKIFYPWAILVMLAVSLPFAYLNARSGGMAIKIFFGLMIGISFYAFNNIFSFLGVLHTWPGAVVATAPTAFMLFMAAIVLWLVERR